MLQGRRAVTALLLLVLGLLGSVTLAFYLHAPKQTCPGSSSSSSSSSSTRVEADRRGYGDMDTRRAWIPKMAFSLLTPLLLTSGAAVAADSARLGTKKDPVYEKCLSGCIYFCLKPKGAETRTRADCLPDCKIQCAQTDAQKMLGVPKK